MSGFIQADVLVIGGGIAGASAAFFAHRAGREVTLVDAGRHRASDVPIALVNPLRGREGRLVPRGIEGMRTTFGLIDTLLADGHRIVHGRGVVRPLLDVPPEAVDEAWWRKHVPADLAFDWLAHAPASLGLARDVPALRLADAGWVETRGFLAALRAASGATVRVDEVTLIDASHNAVACASGATFTARTIVWCGGAWGASRVDEAASDAIYRPGSLIACTTPRPSHAMSFGLYAVPGDGGRSTTWVGPTHEPVAPLFDADNVPSQAIGRLQARVGGVFATTVDAVDTWRGVRLERLSTATVQTLDGVATITALGSRGYLVGPLIAAEWAASL